jgi:hypothetical protein
MTTRRIPDGTTVCVVRGGVVVEAVVLARHGATRVWPAHSLYSVRPLRPGAFPIWIRADRLEAENPDKVTEVET